MRAACDCTFCKKNGKTSIATSKYSAVRQCLKLLRLTWKGFGFYCITGSLFVNMYNKDNLIRGLS